MKNRAASRQKAGGGGANSRGGRVRAAGAWLRGGITMSLLALATSPTWGGAQVIEDRSFVTAAGDRVQQLETVLEAPVDEVWSLLTTEAGLRSWMAPVVGVELRNGGRWEASYDPTKEIGDPGNIVNEIVAFIPGRLLVLRVQAAPPDYPLDLDLVRAARAVYELEPLDDGRSRLRVSGVGYGTGEEWDRIYQIGLSGNRASLEELHKRISSGPRDWGPQ